jgi:pimeloyl-ACP methyl ester carboxylesterase
MMQRISISLLLLVTLLTLGACRKHAAWSDSAAHKSGFVTANGIRLNYLDWGGSAPVLIFIHGLQDNPHIYDDLAPAFTDRFRVIAYARRGHGMSEAKEPYDTATLTEDLRGLMDALGITKAHLAGWSMGGEEITAMAGTHPERVDRIVYLDAAYDPDDPLMEAADKAMPAIYNPPAAAMASLDAWRAYEMNAWYPGVNDSSRLEAYVRELVVIQPDGTVRNRMNDSTAQAVGTTLRHRDYSKVHCPALAIYAQSTIDVSHGDSARIAESRAWEEKYMGPFRAASIERIKRQLPGIEVVKVPGTHMDFVLNAREQVVTAMRRFLTESGPKS